MADSSTVTAKQHIILPDASKMPRNSDSFFRWLGFFLHPYRHSLIFFTLLRVARFTVLSMLPFIIGQTINGFEQGWAFDDPQRLMTLLGGYFTLYAMALLSIVLFIHESAAQDRMIRGTTLFCIRHMNSLPLSWHENQGSGGKLQRVMTARNSMKQLYNMYKWFLTPFTGTLIGVTLSVMLIDAPSYFLLLYAGFMVTFFIGAYYTAKPLPKLHNNHNILLEKLLSGVYEFVSSVRTVKAFNMEDYIQRKARESEGSGHEAMFRVFKAIFRKWGILNSIGLFWMVTFLVVCVNGVYGGWLTIGAFATSFYLAYDLWKMLENMVFIQDEVIEHRNGFMRLTETLKAAPKALDEEPVTSVQSPWEKLSFSAVDFGYGKGEEDSHALHNINLAIARGEKIALVGPSGAGKSTLVKLLMKQMWPDKGTITLDNTDLKNIRSGEWLSQIGFVPQDVELFNMSVRDNILLDRIDETDEETYQNALKQSALSEFIDSLPEKDATIIGERGIKLSGGQRQRLGIARALVRQAELIVFDEATSSLDSLSEQSIQQAIEESFAGKTLVVIAHRLSTVRHVDRIYVLEDGRIVEEGNFRDLVKKGGTFAHLWALQSDIYQENVGKEAV